MRLATWNVNSIRQREPHVRAWLERVRPDVLFLQEIKCEAPQFPTPAFAELGYQAGADRQLKVYEQTGSTVSVVDYIHGQFLE